jgi:thioredoxin-like negative regulator of GroEL
MLSPMLDERAGPLTNQVKFVKINVDEATALAQRFEIQGVPTLVLFKAGKVVDRSVGLPSRDALKAQLESLAKVDPVARNFQKLWMAGVEGHPKGKFV